MKIKRQSPTLLQNRFRLMLSGLLVACFVLTNDASAQDAKAICDLINNLPPISIGSVSIDKPLCSFTEYDNFYYFGSVEKELCTKISTDPKATPPLPARRPEATVNALYCAIRDADGATADATVDTPVGRFGMESRIHIYRKDPKVLQVSGQRLGRLFVFGVGMDLENQGMDWVFQLENSPIGSGTMARGYYGRLKTSTYNWKLGGSGLLGPFKLSLNFGQNSDFQALNTNGFAFTPAAQPNTPHPAFLLENVQNTCLKCKQECKPSQTQVCICFCPTPEELQKASCPGCGDAFYQDLNDAKLPYLGGSGGMRGKYFYPETSWNWFHFGLPGYPSFSTASLPSLTAPIYNTDANQTTFFNASFGFDYEVIQLSLNLGVLFRNGFTVTQHFWPPLDVGAGIDSKTTLFARTDMDAESKVKLNARLILDFPFPFIEHPIIDETFDIVNTGKSSGMVSPTLLRFDADTGFPFYRYNVMGNDHSDAQAALQSCINVPPETKPAVPPANPQDFVKQVGEAALDNIHPCHVVVCRPSSLSDPSGLRQLDKCEWNPQTRKLDCVTVEKPSSCDACQNRAELCDSAGNTFKPTSSNNHCTPQIK